MTRLAWTDDQQTIILYLLFYCDWDTKAVLCLQICHSLLAPLSSSQVQFLQQDLINYVPFCSVRLHLFIVPAGWSRLLKTYIVVNILFIPLCCLGGTGRRPGEILRDGAELTGTAYFSQILPKITDKVCHNHLFTFPSPDRSDLLKITLIWARVKPVSRTSDHWWCSAHLVPPFVIIAAIDSPGPGHSLS